MKTELSRLEMKERAKRVENRIKVDKIKKLIKYCRTHAFDKAAGDTISKTLTFLELISDAENQVEGLEAFVRLRERYDGY
jgi:hypothetical protein